MHDGQKQFYDYIMEKTSSGMDEEAKRLLKECFDRQNSSTFTATFLNDVTPKILATLKPEFVSEVRMVMEQFGSLHIN